MFITRLHDFGTYKETATTTHTTSEYFNADYFYGTPFYGKSVEDETEIRVFLPSQCDPRKTALSRRLYSQESAVALYYSVDEKTSKAHSFCYTFLVPKKDVRVEPRFFIIRPEYNKFGYIAQKAYTHKPLPRMLDYCWDDSDGKTINCINIFHDNEGHPVLVIRHPLPVLLSPHQILERNPTMFEYRIARLNIPTIGGHKGVSLTRNALSYDPEKYFSDRIRFLLYGFVHLFYHPLKDWARQLRNEDAYTWALVTDVELELKLRLTDNAERVVEKLDETTLD